MEKEHIHIYKSGIKKISLNNIFSKQLKRNTHVDFYLPANFELAENLPILLMNDGQDAEALKIASLLEKHYYQKAAQRFILIAIHAHNRIHEYGVIGKPDAHKRGNLAGKYSLFVVEELLPYAKHEFNVNLNHTSNTIFGFSLGGLMAVSLAWNYPNIFKNIGAFSGSFWWRAKELNQGYTDNDKIMHAVIRKGKINQGLKFWFQAGTRDENSDRNNNGIIDSIDDTLDLIAELIKIGYKPYYDIEYYEMERGEHNQKTWSEALPVFFNWLFSNK